MKKISLIMLLGILLLIGTGCSSIYSKNSQNKMATIEVEATYKERIGLLPGSIIVATLEDISKMDVKSIQIASVEEEAGNPPYKIEIKYPKNSVDTKKSYNVRVQIFNGEKLLFTSTSLYNPFRDEKEIIILQKIN